MTQFNLDDVIKKAASESSFEMDPSHMAQAMDMINKRKKRRGAAFFWWFGATSLAIVVAGLGWNMFVFDHEAHAALNAELNNSSHSILANKSNVELKTNNNLANTNDQTKPLNILTETSIKLNTGSSSDNSKTSSTTNKSNGSNLSEVNKLLKKTIATQPSAKPSNQTSTSVNKTPIVASNSIIKERSILLIESISLLHPSQISTETTKLKATNTNIYSGPKWKLSPWINMSMISLKESNSRLGNIDLGLSIKYKLVNDYYLALEPSLSFLTQFEDLHNIQKVENFGLEVVNSYYSIQPNWMIFGNTSFVIGKKWKRWNAQLGPAISFLPFASGEIHSLDVDQTIFTKTALIGQGAISNNNSQKFNWGGTANLSYYISPCSLLGFQVDYRNQKFFTSNDIRSKVNLDAFNLGLRYQYSF